MKHRDPAPSPEIDPSAIRDPHPVVSAIWVGRDLLGVTALLAALANHSWTQAAASWSGGQIPVIDGLLAGFFSTNVVLSLLDCRSRYQNFKRLKDQMFLNGTGTKYLKAFTVSRCQREAALSAGKELGLTNELKIKFRQSGYRWYHFIPDFAYRNPLFFTDTRFWRHTFFAPHYRARIDYKKFTRQQGHAASSAKAHQELPYNPGPRRARSLPLEG